MKITMGTFRPNWSEFCNLRANIMCSCGRLLEFQSSVRKHYNMGHFDTVQTIEIDEKDIIQRIINKVSENIEAKMEQKDGKENNESSSDGKKKEEGSPQG